MAELIYLPYLQVKGDHELKKNVYYRDKNWCGKKKHGMICKDISC